MIKVHFNYKDIRFSIEDRDIDSILTSYDDVIAKVDARFSKGTISTVEHIEQLSDTPSMSNKASEEKFEMPF